MIHQIILICLQSGVNTPVNVYIAKKKQKRYQMYKNSTHHDKRYIYIKTILVTAIKIKVSG